MTKLIIKILLIKLIFAVFVVSQGYWYWLLNFELSFFASMLIVLGSFVGYKRMINRNIEKGDGIDQSLFEKLEDPYDLYDESDEIQEETDKEKTPLELVKEEKKRMKGNKQTIKKTIKSTPGIFSPYRILPYAFLILSFIALNNNNILDIQGFLIGLAGGIVAAVLVGKRWIQA